MVRELLLVSICVTFNFQGLALGIELIVLVWTSCCKIQP